ncbi:MAG TPA: protein kinase [Vicinamibacterales bacterium]|nr:protein kinase [Vicinamibacterales bacterium]
MATTRSHAAATTRATSSIHVPAAEGGQLLAPTQVIFSPETKLQYRIERMLGAGGFGQAYLATRRGRSTTIPEQVCIKVSARIDGWLREAYFGLLLDGHPRAVRVFDRFPLMRADGQVLYYLALEYACHGDLSAHLQAGRTWTEAAARREIAGILAVLGKLHRGQLLHRDLTPMNVFVCEGRRLKLGDFGIVRQQSDRRGVTASTMNASMVPSDLLASSAPKWQARDDVYQVGQLLGMLIKGDARARIRPAEVRSLACSDHLKEIIYRCIGERRKRYEGADEMITALRTPPARLDAGVTRSLDGVHLAFTGILSRPREEARLAARRAGAIVHGAPSAQTTVLVRGRPNPLQAAGRDGGVKLLEIKRLREKGHRIRILGDAAFWRLVETPASGRRRTEDERRRRE